MEQRDNSGVIKHKELVSIVLPVYNGSRTIEGTLNSVLNQTFSDFMIYVCDDASTDNSLDLIRKFKSEKIRLITNPKNMGLSKTRKKILERAEGQYLAFIDQDDIWHKNKLELQIPVMEDKGCVMCHTNYTLVNSLLNIKKEVIADPIVNYEQMKKGCTIGASTVVINKNILKKELAFNDDRFFDSMSDYVIWLSVLRPSEKAFFSFGVNKSLVEYVFHGRNLSRNKAYQLVKHFIAIRKLEKTSLPKALYYSCCNLVTKIKYYFFR